MEIKISLTTRCNAKCKTCDVWCYKGTDMQLKNFYTIFEKIINCDHVNGIMLGSTGESYLHPNIDMIFDYVEEKQKKVPIVPISLTTNGSFIFIISRFSRQNPHKL